MGPRSRTGGTPTGTTAQHVADRPVLVETPEPAVGVEPVVTVDPAAAVRPAVSVEPGVSVEPAASVQSGVTVEPAVSVEPGVTVRPGGTVEPAVDGSADPVARDLPQATDGARAA